MRRPRASRRAASVPDPAAAARCGSGCALNEMNVELLTVGHSNHPLETFLELLQAHEIEVLVDIRRFPGSRKYPHFGQESLAASVRDLGIEYRWMEDLGGRRKAQKVADPSPNRGLRNQSFRNYADYMLTDSFRQAAAELLDLAASRRTAIMCSESVFWRCHRRLVSDYVVANGGRVLHIFPNGIARPHDLTRGAVPVDGVVSYPGEKTLFDQ